MNCSAVDRRFGIILGLLAAHFALLPQLVCGQDAIADLKTVAEQSGYQATGRYSDVIQFIDRLDASADHVQRIDFGASVEGRALPAVVVARPAVSNPSEVGQDGRIVVLLLGGIHAGECDGKEAILMLLRELAANPEHAWLQQMVLVVVPQFNVDGGERVGTQHRDEQLGPAAGAGRRENAQQLDLNRDYIKLESPEVRALVSLMQVWQPHVFIDTHTTNGSRHRYALTYDVPHNPAALSNPVDFLRTDLLPAVTARLAAQGLDTFYYGNFNDQYDRWTTYGHEPRYGTEYAGLLGAVSILAESYSHLPYEQRIDASKAFVAACLDELAAKRGQVSTVVNEARAQVASQGARPEADDMVSIRAALAPLPGKSTIKGFEQAADKHDQAKDYEVEIWGRAESRLQVARPFAYIVPKNMSRVADRLRMHGLLLEELTAAIEADVEVYRAQQVQRGQGFQNHRLVSCEVEKRTEKKTLEAGSYVVRLEQPLGNLAVYLLEPQSDDGLLTWNFFDASFWKKGDDFPIVRIAQPIPLAVQKVMAIESRQMLDLDQIYGPERRVNFTPPFPIEVKWLPKSTKYLQSYGGVMMAVDAESGAMSPWYDRSIVARALDGLPEISTEEAAALAGSSSEVSPAGDALLFEHANDLYYCRMDGSGARRLTSTPGAEELATFSPDGTMIAFVRKNNMFVVDVVQSREWPLTTEGDDQHLFGKLDWVYQEEVYGRGDFQAFWWSSDSQRIALLALDETPVHRYTVTDHIPYRQQLEVTPYPKAGDPMPKIQLGVVSAAGGEVQWITHEEYSATDHLIVRVTWDTSGKNLYYQVQNREQTWLDLRRVAAGTTSSSKLFRETSTGWIDPLGEPRFLNDGGFLWLSQRSGFTHIYKVTADGTSVVPVTQGEWEVRSLHGVDPQNEYVYFQAALENRIAEQTYRAAIGGGAPTRITNGEGHNSARFNEQLSHFLNSYSGIQRPAAMRACRSDGTFLHSIAPGLDDQLKYYRLSEPELLRVPVRDGYELDAWLIKPLDFDPARKYPVLCYVYGGPQAPVVSDRWSGNNFLWHQMLAQRGYCIWICDNRSASLHGIRNTWPVHRRLGEQELQDLEDSLDWLGKNAWVDSARIGIWGWSYGGYFTAYAMTHSNRFRVGISGAPVTDWRNYDSIYTERLMGLPQENPQGYASSSPLEAAERLHGSLLLVHGDADDNVHVANTLQLSRALQRAGKTFSLMIYPQSRHGISDPNQSRHLQDLMTRFLEQNL